MKKKETLGAVDTMMPKVAISISLIIGAIVGPSDWVHMSVGGLISIWVFLPVATWAWNRMEQA